MGWKQSHIDRMIATLRESDSVLEATETLARLWKMPVGQHAVRKAFSVRGLPPPSDYLRKWSAEEDEPPDHMLPQEDAPAVEDRAVVETEARAQPSKKFEQFDALLAAVKKGPVSLEGLCDRLDMSPGKLRALVSDARDAGLSVEIDGSHIGRPPRQESSHEDEAQIRMPAPINGRQMFAVCSDIHVGSKHHLADYLEDFVERAYVRGVRKILCPGDLLDGVYKHSVWEQTHRGFDEQVREAARTLPRRPGLSWEFIIGNHEQTFEDSCGLDVGRAIVDTFRSEGRHDWTYHGARGAYLRLVAPGERGMVVEMWHPKKGTGYALSYGMQNHIRDYAVGAKPDCLLVGHWHQQCYFVSRGVHAMSCGTWQGGKSSYGRSLGGSPAIGGWVVDYATTKDGTVREFTPTWNAYYENEAARDVMMTIPAFGDAAE